MEEPEYPKGQYEEFGDAVRDLRDTIFRELKLYQLVAWLEGKLERRGK